MAGETSVASSYGLMVWSPRCGSELHWAHWYEFRVDEAGRREGQVVGDLFGLCLIDNLEHGDRAGTAEAPRLAERASGLQPPEVSCFLGDRRSEGRPVRSVAHAADHEHIHDVRLAQQQNVGSHLATIPRSTLSCATCGTS